MNNDILMSSDDDIMFQNNDLVPTDSIDQEATIRLRWYQEEWRFNTDLGIDWFGQGLIKNPNEAIIAGMVIKELINIEGVAGVEDVEVVYGRKRNGYVFYNLVLESGEKLRKELEIRNSI